MLATIAFSDDAGERGSDLGSVKKHGPPKLIAAGKNFLFIVVSRQCPQDKSWEPPELMAQLDEMSGKYKVDTDRTYVTGLSNGRVRDMATNRLLKGRNGECKRR